MLKNRKLIFIILLVIDLIYTYFAIKGEVNFYHGFVYNDSLALALSKYIVLSAPIIVHYLPGGTRDNLKDTLKYTVPLFVLLFINVIIPVYLYI